MCLWPLWRRHAHRMGGQCWADHERESPYPTESGIPRGCAMRRGASRRCTRLSSVAASCCAAVRSGTLFARFAIDLFCHGFPQSAPGRLAPGHTRSYPISPRHEFLEELPCRILLPSSPKSSPSATPRSRPRSNCSTAARPCPSSPATARKRPACSTTPSCARWRSGCAICARWTRGVLAIIESIKEQGKLTAEIEQALLAADTKARLEDIYLPFKEKRRTKAQIAKEAGLEPLADMLLSDPMKDPDNGRQGRSSRRMARIRCKDIKAALEGARAILVERFAEHADLIGSLREEMWGRGAARIHGARRQEDGRRQIRRLFRIRRAL